MENQRQFLWIMLAVILFALYNEWQKDYAPVSPVISEQVLTSNEVLPVLGAPGVDGPVNQVSASVNNPATVSVKKGTPVSLKTDVYDIEFNTLGAGINKMLLTQKPKEKTKPDDLVELFGTNANDVYLLNNGLRAGGVKSEPTHLVEWQSTQAAYELAAGKNDIKIPFTWQSPEGLMVTKTYIFQRNNYAFSVEFTVENKTATAIQVRPYAELMRSHGEQERSMVSVDSYSFKGPTWYNGEKYKKLDLGDLEDEKINTDIINGWFATIEHHFLAAIIPAVDVAYNFSATAKEIDDRETYTLTAAAPTKNIAPGQSIQINQQYYAGPKNQKNLRALSPKLDLTTDYGFFSIVSKPLFSLLAFVQSFIGNWGWSIIVVTLIIKAAFYPLTAKSARSMAGMKKIQPRIKALQERYKDDKPKLSQATMDLYKKEKINPAAGCLPVLIQFPFFLGFYWLLIESVELRQAPWMMWIQDLSTKDPLFILPVLYGITMYLQQKVQPMSGGNAEMMKVMKFMPIAMVGLFSFFPAGLVLYWITNSAVTVLQQWRINGLLAKEK